MKSGFVRHVEPQAVYRLRLGLLCGGVPLSYTELNARLVEEFGNLERLCSQMYNEQYGVTCYIEDMNRTYGGSAYITNWEWNLRRLKDVRHKRNNLSHGNVSFSSPWAEHNDINFVTDFRSHILNGSDPLAQYRRFSQPKLASKLHPTPSSHITVYRQPAQPPRQPIGCGLCITLISAIAVAVIWLVSQI